MQKKSPLIVIRNYFIAGVVATAPVALTVFLVYFIVRFVDENVGKIIPGHLYEGVYSSIPGIGVFIAVAFFICVGWLVTNILGRWLMRVWEYCVLRIPVINTLYGTLKQVFDTLAGTKGQAFREVVLVEFAPAQWSLAFVTGTPEGDLKDKLPGDDHVLVFIPDAPSPLNGSLIMIERKKTIPLAMSVEQGIKMIVSIGMLPPEEKKPV